MKYEKKNKSLYADLTQRIQVREVTNTPESTGGMNTTFVAKTIVWGRVRPIGISQQIGFYVREMQISVAPTHTIRMRVNKELGVTRTGLQGNMYLYVEDRDGKGRSFRILAPIDKEDRGIELCVLVKEMGLQFGEDNLL